MFAGIIEGKSKIVEVDQRGKNFHVSIGKPTGWKLVIGQSVNIDGVCSTVVDTRAKRFDVIYMPETISKTTAGGLRKGSTVNLERSLKFGAVVDGHLVQGHIDARANVAEISQNKHGYLLSVLLPKELLSLAAERGSIAINGVSLTIARSRKNLITVALIPHTLAHTNLGELKKGHEVNVEMDLFARYSAQLLKGDTVKPHAKNRSNKKG